MGETNKLQRELIALWKKYREFYLNRNISKNNNKKDGLPYLRDKLFIAILLVSIPLGIIAYIPSIFISIQTHQYVIAIFNSLALGTVIFLFFNKNLSIFIKKIVFGVNLYNLATILMIYLGIRGPGIILFFCISIFTTLLYNKKIGIIATITNSILYFVFVLSMSLNLINLSLDYEFTLEAWTVVGINLIIINIGTVFSVAFLIDHLQQSFLNGQKLQIRLKRKNIALLAAKQKSEESDKLKTAFLSNMSHEIRTPMNGVLGFAGLLKNPNLSGEKQQEYLSLIEKGGKRMLNIINNIISMSKIESGQMEINIQESNINNQINSIRNVFNPQIKEKGIQFFFSDFLPWDEAIIKTDKEKVNDILTNLINNAIKYTTKGFIEIGYHKLDNFLEFYVKDTGLGIPLNRQNAIFERFIQADISDKLALQGAGLGLSISKVYIEMLGGKIWVDSEEDVGSTFYFTLPYHNNLAEKSIENNYTTFKDEEHNSNNLKILIAEDDKMSAALISIIIRKYCKTPLKAKTGKEAIDICRKNPDIDLILMDIQMPEINGHEATRQIRQFNNNVVIVAQTAFGHYNDKKMMIEAGCNDYITKPISKDIIHDLIQNHINNSV